MTEKVSVSLARQRVAVIRKQLAEPPEERGELLNFLRGAVIMLGKAADELEGKSTAPARRPPDHLLRIDISQK
jgi:hypothetical protein